MKENFEQQNSACSEDGQRDSERPIPAEPKLRHIYKSLELLRPERDPLGDEMKWQELYKLVKPYENALELSDNVRDAVRDYLGQKVPRLKEAVPSIGHLDDKKLLDALSHNWFEDIGEVEGQRKAVLLSVMAHIVKRIETTAYRKILENTPDEDLEKLNLDLSTRDLLTSVMDASVKADAMFIRFLAFSQLSGKPPEEARAHKFYVPGNETPQTLSKFFPHEAQFISKRFSSLAQTDAPWQEKPGGSLFRDYLTALSDYFKESDPEQAEEHHKKILELYSSLLSTDFPIILTPFMEGQYHEPYVDPELKVSLRTPEAIKEEELYRKAQLAMSESLSILGVEQFAEDMRQYPPRSGIVLGAYGVNLNLNAVAQGYPRIIVYLNEELRSFDRNFPSYMDLVKNSEEAFVMLNPEEREERMEFMSRMNTVMHEISHAVYPHTTSEAKRMGGKTLTNVEETTADVLFRPLVPSVLEKEGLNGTKEQWAIAMLASSLQSITGSTEGGEYYLAAGYHLNVMFDEGIVVLEENGLRITDFDRWYESQRLAARGVLSVYQDEKMNERRAAHWVNRHCKPNEKVLAAAEFVKRRIES